MSGSKPYAAELRRPAVRMVVEVRPNYESDWAAMKGGGGPAGDHERGDGCDLVRQAQVNDALNEPNRDPPPPSRLLLGRRPHAGRL